MARPSAWATSLAVAWCSGANSPPTQCTFFASYVFTCSNHSSICRTREVFFTRNGSHLGVAFKINPASAAAAAYSAATIAGGAAAGAAATAAAAESRRMSFYPTIGLHAKHEEVSVNFGASPFTFDIQAYEEDILAEFEAAVSSCDLPPLPLINMVRQHLAFSGMHASLQALDKQVKDFFVQAPVVLQLLMVTNPSG
jgi:hypothetical protein